MRTQRNECSVALSVSQLLSVFRNLPVLCSSLIETAEEMILLCLKKKKKEKQLNVRILTLSCNGRYRLVSYDTVEITS